MMKKIKLDYEREWIDLFTKLVQINNTFGF